MESDLEDSLVFALDAGDADGDGYADALLRLATSTVGELRLYSGGPDGLTGDYRLLTTPEPTAFLGYDAAVVDDIDGDGVSEVLVGDRGYDDGLYLQGGAFLLLSDPASEGASWQLRPDEGELTSCLGAELAEVGDVNGDGQPEYAVGDLCAESDMGAVFLFTAVSE